VLLLSVLANVMVNKDEYITADALISAVVIFAPHSDMQPAILILFNDKYDQCRVHENRK